MILSTSKEELNLKIEPGMTALLTGASRGMGVHVARALAARGVHLVLAARSAAGLESVTTALRADYGIRVLAVPTDMAQEAGLKALVEAALAEFGRIDILVNNAGLESAQDYECTDVGELRQMIEVNLLAPMLLSRWLLPEMLKSGRGHIVNIASVAGLISSGYEEPYNASKFGLVGFSRALRLTAQDRRWPVSASVICPGFMSGAGMFADMIEQHGVSAPKAAGSIAAERLGPAVIRAIERDLPDLILMPGTPRLNVALSMLLPRVFEKVIAWLNLAGPFRKIAETRRAEQARESAIREAGKAQES